MDKVIIYGAFEFLGFHFCNKLLEKGYSVKGIHYHTIGNDNLDEKRLEIGRNANFEELTIHDSENLMEDNDKSVMVIFPLYDLFITGNESLLTNCMVLDPIFKFLNGRKQQQDKIVYLLPIQLLADSHDIDGIKELREFLLRTREITKDIQFFYLPTIFGQWQPSACLFQRVISNLIQADKEPFLRREWVLDAIFIEDILGPIVETIEGKKVGRFLLESGIPDSWNKCADILKIDKSYRGGGDLKITADEQIARISLTKVTPLHESLLMQREHLSQLTWLKE